MIKDLSQLTTFLTENPEKAAALVASGVFGWDTVLDAGSDRWRLTVFHTVARSPALTDGIVATARDWFQQQPDGAKRWTDLLWSTGTNANVPVVDAVDHQCWDTAAVLTRAMRDASLPEGEDRPYRLRATAWMERWHRRYEKDPQGWAQAASWLTANDWVTAQDWATPFEVGQGEGRKFPLQAAVETHGLPELWHLLDLGALPRGNVEYPEYMAQDPKPLMLYLLDSWFLGPSVVSQQRNPVLQQAYLGLVKTDLSTIQDQVVPFASSSKWPKGLLASPFLTATERASLTAQAEVRGPGRADLPMTLILRAVGPDSVRLFLESQVLREELDTQGSSMDVEARPRARL